MKTAKASDGDLMAWKKALRDEGTSTTKEQTAPHERSKVPMREDLASLEKAVAQARADLQSQRKPPRVISEEEGRMRLGIGGASADRAPDDAGPVESTHKARPMTEKERLADEFKVLQEKLAAPDNLPYRVGVDTCVIDRIRDMLLREQAKIDHVTRFWGGDDKDNLSNFMWHKYLEGSEETPKEGDEEGNEPSWSKLWHRVMTPHELGHPLIKPLASADIDRQAQFLAGRWAVKEAVIKAWPAHTRRRIYMQDIVCFPATKMSPEQPFSTPPRVFVRVPRPADDLGGQFRLKLTTISPPSAIGDLASVFAKIKQAKSATAQSQWHEMSVSISHDGGIANAVAIYHNES
jgi:phosphopantetheinyl transferase (holo-ACP synthase)